VNYWDILPVMHCAYYGLTHVLCCVLLMLLQLSPFNGFIYITVTNIISSCVAVYGLMLLRGAFQPELEKDFAITGKIASLQLTLLSSAIPNLIIGILVSTDVIKCSPIFPSKARGEGDDLLKKSQLELADRPISLT
jgi:Organic solute transporter Ostalpha